MYWSREIIPMRVFDEKDMLAELEKNRVYEFERGDYLKVAII